MTTMTAILAIFALLLLLASSHVEGACYDKLPDCSRYPKSTCTKYDKWAKSNCEKRCGFCTDPPPSKYCPNGWVYAKSDNTCNQIFGVLEASERKNWNEARYDCRIKMGDLATIKSKGKNDFLSSLVGGDTDFWIGLERKYDNFQYVDGNILTSYSYKNWGYYEPNNSKGNEDCVEMLRDGKWNDLNCLTDRGYICQRSAIN